MYCNQCARYRKGYCSVKKKEVGYLQVFPCFEPREEENTELPEETETIIDKPINTTTMETRTCKHCGRELPLENFATYRGKPTSVCKECKREFALKGGKNRHKPAEETRRPQEKPAVTAAMTSPLEGLTWEDVRDIVKEADFVLETMTKKDLLLMGEANYYTKVLCRVIANRS